MSPAAGARQVEIEVRECVREINRAALSASESGLNIMHNAAQEVLSKNGSGRSYGGKVASAPGETPAPQSGWLRDKWQRSKAISGNLRITLRLKSNMFYQPFLEHGTRKMAPRPHMDKIADKSLPQVAALFANL